MDEAKLKTKFNNIFINLLYSVMTNDLSKVRHFLSDEVAAKFEAIIERNKANNETQMYDELNVKDISISSVEEVDGKEVVKAVITSRYMDYIIDSNTGEYKRGINDHRVEKLNYLTFQKNLDAKDKPIIFKCPHCGADMDINFTGKCNFCRKVVDITDYEYILTDITTN